MANQLYKKITLWRPHLSSYFDQSYLEEEKKLAHDLGFLYHFSPHFPKEETPFILLSNTHLTASFFRKIKNNCALIIHANSGHDGIPLSFAQNFKAPIILGNPIRSQAVAEYVLAAILKHNMGHFPFVKKWDDKRLFGRGLLKEKNVQLIGLGHVGKEVYKILKPLVRKIYISDPYQEKNNLKFNKADILILCSELNSQNKKMISKKVFAQLLPTVHLINPARGGLIDEKELIKFLLQNPKACATLDVFEKEPFDQNKFKQLKNINTSSHIAGVFEQLPLAQLTFIKKVLKHYLSLSPSLFKKRYQHLHLQHKIKGHFS